ncbi:hypothetical protein AB1Y20_006135 [Prymnesium parvum]|uniref:NADP-dependent oxidoreductase domain-containing protein n=1 Tax=Prymnesium parvum TaxID=97485 RepID=A0AB34J3Q4_PRYPA
MIWRLLLLSAGALAQDSCPPWCAKFACDGSTWCQKGEKPAPCVHCGDGGEAKGVSCFKESCADVGGDCCAPPQLNEAMKCTNGLHPVRLHTDCFNFKGASYTCCGSLPTTTLSNGVEMPKVILGAGGSTWMNVDKTDLMVYNALKHGGFRAVDTANHYRNHEGVARGIRSARRDGYEGEVWLQTKVEGCGNSKDPRSPVLQGHCYEHTLARLHDDLRQLQVDRVDLALLHAPPCVPGAACEMVQQQWKALEAAYAQGKARAIGVSNYCSACLQCLMRVATVTPHVNQIQLHAGMGSADPGGLVEYTLGLGAKIQAYRPLGQGRLMSSSTVHDIANAHGKSPAQVAVKWVVQQGHTAVTTTESIEHMRSNLDVFDWDLSSAEMSKLSNMAPPGQLDNVVGELCVL